MIKSKFRIKKLGRSRHFWTRFSPGSKKLRWAFKLIVGLMVILFLYIVIILGTFRSFLWNAPSLFGFFGTSQYLVLFQNNYELRPTGGFISAYAVLTFQFGKPTLQVHDSYSIESPSNKKAPKPLETFLKLDPKYRGFQFRDANFDPDFVSSVSEVLGFYHEKYPDQQFDGVMGVDLFFLEELLDLYGEVTINGKTYTRDNFFLSTQMDVKNIDLHNEASLEQRKGVLQSIGSYILGEIVFSPMQYPKLINVVERNLKEKHMLLFFEDESLQSTVEQKNWGGRLNGEAYDNFISIDVSNIGGRKADRYLSKQYEYFLSFDDQGVAHLDVDITFKHLGTYSLQSDLYQGYIRTFVPKDAQIDEVNGDYWKGLESEFTYDRSVLHDSLAVGTYVHLFPDESRRIHLRFTLPERIRDETVSLNVIKQPGTWNDVWQIAIQMPSEVSMKNVQSDTLTVADNVGTWKGILIRDMHFEVEKIEDIYPPIVVKQEFISLGEILLQFDETVQEESVMNPNNFAITDLNYIDDETDTIAVKHVSLSKKDLVLEVEGIKRSEEERYEIKLKDIRDRNGNYMQPNPFGLTVVQRLR